MLMSEAKMKREFIVKNCPYGCKARNISKNAWRGIESVMRAYSGYTGSYDVIALARGEANDVYFVSEKMADFEIEPRHADAMNRAYQMAVEYLQAKGA